MGQEIVSVVWNLRCFVVEGPVPKQTLTEAGEDSFALKLLRICSFYEASSASSGKTIMFLNERVAGVKIKSRPTRVRCNERIKWGLRKQNGEMQREVDMVVEEWGDEQVINEVGF